MTFCVGSKIGFYPDVKAKNATNLSDDVLRLACLSKSSLLLVSQKKVSVFDLISCQNYGMQ